MDNLNELFETNKARFGLSHDKYLNFIWINLWNINSEIVYINFFLKNHNITDIWKNINRLNLLIPYHNYLPSIIINKWLFIIIFSYSDSFINYYIYKSLFINSYSDLSFNYYIYNSLFINSCYKN